MPFAQVVVGPPGSGKTTYCAGVRDFLNGIERDTIIVNLDPANDHTTDHSFDIDINDLISIGPVMKNFNLGPNGGLMYCIEYLEKNIDWLQKKLLEHPKDYIIFDCPGQVELYTHHKSMRNILKILEKDGFRITCVHLIDSYYCTNPHNYISAVTLCLSVMLQLELPHVNVLSKIDKITSYGKLDLNLDFYTECQDLNVLQHVLEKGHATAKHKNLTAAICDVIEDFGLVSFATLDIQDKTSVLTLMYTIDKANGYSYSGLPSANTISNSISLKEIDSDYYRVGAIQEKYVDMFDLEDGEENANQTSNNHMDVI
jgi:GTPase SAR1 family protein